ncbi:MAG: hypothetical protein AAGB32_01640, partial [Pseudomonadota bacterium]
TGNSFGEIASNIHFTMCNPTNIFIGLSYLTFVFLLFFISFKIIRLSEVKKTKNLSSEAITKKLSRSAIFLGGIVTFVGFFGMMDGASFCEALPRSTILVIGTMSLFVFSLFLALKYLISKAEPNQKLQFCFYGLGIIIISSHLVWGVILSEALFLN